jgi:hypothetical protein
MSLNDFEYRDTISSTEITERIDELEELGDEGRTGLEDEELADLKAFAEEAESYVSDWEYGVTLVNDAYFEQYAEDEVSEIFDIDTNTFPYYCMDWQRVAEDMQYDWTEINLGSTTFWIGNG